MNNKLPLPLGASVRGFAAWQFALLLKEPLGKRLAELERSPGVHSGYVTELRRTFAQIVQAGELWREWMACAGGSVEAVETEITPDSEHVVITPEEAAVLLKVTESRVRQLLRGEVLAGRKVGGRWLIDRDSVVSYMGTPRGEVA